MQIKSLVAAMAVAASATVPAYAGTVDNTGSTSFGAASESAVGATAVMPTVSPNADTTVGFVGGGSSPLSPGFVGGTYFDQLITNNLGSPTRSTTFSFSSAITGFSGNFTQSPFGEDYTLQDLISKGFLSAKPVTVEVLDGSTVKDTFTLWDVPTSRKESGPTYVPSVFGFTYAATGGSFNGFRLIASVNDTETYGLKVTSVSAVPEPETYAMMLAGLGALGFMARRRRIG